jgi:hypothetical protein
MRSRNGPRLRPRRSGSELKKWILALSLILSPLLLASESPQPSPPPSSELSTAHAPLVVLTEEELEAIIQEAVDDAVARSVQVAMAEERANTAAVEVERDDALARAELAEAGQERAERSAFWLKLSAILASLLAAGACGGLLLGH